MTAAIAPQISVIVPLFDAEAWVRRCIEGLLAQTVPADHFEILVIDNNSADRGPAVASGYPRVRLLREPRQGAYAARNRGLAEARGELIAFTDPDCVPDPDWLQRLTAPFAEPGVRVVNGRVLPGSDARSLAMLHAYEHHRDRFIFDSHDPLLYFGHTNNMATRRSVLDEMGRFRDRARGSDAIFVRQVTDRYGCDAVRYEPRARVVHLEMDGLGTYFRKGRIYRVSRLSYSRVTEKRSPSLRTRAAILRDAIRSGDIPLMAGPGTLVLLMAAAVYRRVGGPTHGPRPIHDREHARG